MANKKPVGKRANTRHLFKGTKVSVETLLTELIVGDKAVISPNGRYHEGLPFRRFAGKIGKVVEKRGRSCVIQLKKEHKKVIAGPAHLKKIKE